MVQALALWQQKRHDRYQGTSTTMNLAAAMLYPFVLLLPAATTDSGRSADESGYDAFGQSAETVRQAYARDQQLPLPVVSEQPDGASTVTAFQGPEPDSAWQVRIEQRMTIRIAPRGLRSSSTEMFSGTTDDDFDSHFSERKIGKCLPMTGIAGVQPNGSNHLLLFMRDQRIVSAELERACRARDFYSGFYLSRTSDGQLCVDRDTLLSRSGMNCKLKRIRQLVAEDD